MKYLILTKKLSTGIAAIDDQHREFFRRINSFSRHCAQEEPDRERFIKLFTFLREYSIEHFGFEAALMEEYEYPGLVEHLREHAQHRACVDKTREQLETRELTVNFTLEVNYFLVDWFKRHIQSVDKRMSAYLREIAERKADRKLLALIKGLWPGKKDDLRG